jgi:hypothetical protein
MTTAPITSVNVKQVVPFFGVTNMEASLQLALAPGFSNRACPEALL